MVGKESKVDLIRENTGVLHTGSMYLGIAADSWIDLLEDMPGRAQKQGCARYSIRT